MSKYLDAMDNYDYIRENLKPGHDLYFEDPFYEARLRLVTDGSIIRSFVRYGEKEEREIDMKSNLTMNVIMGGDLISEERYYE